MRLRTLIAAGLALGPLFVGASSAWAQAWQRYVYEDAGFAIQFPAAPTVAPADFATGLGGSAPATRYELKQDNVVLSVLAADLSKTKLGKDQAIAEAVRQAGETGAVTLDVTERVDFEYGRELSLQGRDGSRAMMAIFFKNGHLYELTGRALPPDSGGGTARILRFQQSLQFVPGEELR